MQWQIQKGNFTVGQILQYPDKVKWAERLMAWGPGAHLRAPVGSRGKAPGRSQGVLAYQKCPERLSCNIIFL